MNNKHVPLLDRLLDERRRNNDALNAARTMVLALLLILTGSVILNIGFILWCGP